MIAKPVNFKLSQYLSEGFNMLKENFGNIFVAFLFTILMSIIPFCGMVAAGNLYKFLRKIHKGETNASPSEIFNFDDFVPYLIFQLIIFAAIFAVYIPFIFLMPFAAAVQDNGGEPNPIFGILMFPYFAVLGIAIIYFSIKAFYIPALISLKGVTDLKTAWLMSKEMTKGNILEILLYAIVISFLSQIGILACGIGIFLTLPLMYTANYFAFNDALQQINKDEIQEIGIHPKEY